MQKMLANCIWDNPIGQSQPQRQACGHVAAVAITQPVLTHRSAVTHNKNPVQVLRPDTTVSFSSLEKEKRTTGGFLLSPAQSSSTFLVLRVLQQDSRHLTTNKDQV